MRGGEIDGGGVLIERGGPEKEVGICMFYRFWFKGLCYDVDMSDVSFQLVRFKVKFAV